LAGNGLILLTSATFQSHDTDMTQGISSQELIVQVGFETLAPQTQTGLRLSAVEQVT